VVTERHWNDADGAPKMTLDWHTVVPWEGLAATLKGHTDSVIHVAISADGQHILS
jgi:hypothetical protein